ncbi:TPA: transposase [Citrobacter freundii]
MSDELREKMRPLIRGHKTYRPQGRHREHVDNPAAMKPFFFMLRTGCQWKELNATGVCSSSSAQCRLRSSALQTGRSGRTLRGS